MKSLHVSIQERIKKAVESVIAQIDNADAELTKAIKDKEKTYLLINSSFLYREKRLVRTSQSSRRLVAEIARSGEGLCVNDVFVLDDFNIRNHYRILETIENNRVFKLEEVISQELKSLGDVIFVLTGTIIGVQPIERTVSTDLVKVLRLDPTLSDVFKFEDGVCVINNIIPIEDLFDKIGDMLGAEMQLPQDVRQAIAKAYDTLLNEVTTKVVISAGENVDVNSTILGKILYSLKKQAEEYQQLMDELLGNEDNKQVRNELLRIAYNFSTDVLPLIFLFMSICDLKPLVFWCTVDKQWDLYESFASLPWSALGRKEKIEEYRTIIAEARNHAFHHILPFETTIDVDLSNVDVRADSMLLFPSFGSKKPRGIRMKDQELVDVFSEFSRAKQRPVSTKFWKENLNVMKKATDLTRSILDTLMLLRRAQSRK